MSVIHSTRLSIASVGASNVMHKSVKAAVYQASGPPDGGILIDDVAFLATLSFTFPYCIASVSLALLWIE